MFLQQLLQQPGVLRRLQQMYQQSQPLPQQPQTGPP
jgi:hypothetical protein